MIRKSLKGLCACGLMLSTTLLTAQDKTTPATAEPTKKSSEPAPAKKVEILDAAPTIKLPSSTTSAPNPDEKEMRDVDDPDGVLPAGKTSKPATAPDDLAGTAAFKQLNEQVEKCRQVLATKRLGEIIYNPANRSFFALLKVKQETDKNGQLSHRYNIVNIDTRTRSGKAVVGLSLRRPSILLGHGYPLKGVSVLTFQNSTPDCWGADASAVGISLTGNVDVRKSFPAGKYIVVPSDIGSVVLEEASQNLWEFDPTTFQRRSVRKVAKGKIPIFYEHAEAQLFTLTIADAPTVERYDLTIPKKDAELRLKPKMRVVQEGDRFAGMMKTENRNGVVIQTALNWSATVKDPSPYVVTLPEEFAVEDAQWVVNFSKHIGAAYAWSPSILTPWSKAFVINLATGMPIAEFKIATGDYVSEIRIVPDGSTVLLMTKAIATQVVTGVHLFDVASQKWEPIHLMLK